MSLKAFWCWLTHHLWEETDSKYQTVEMLEGTGGYYFFKKGPMPEPKEGVLYIEDSMKCYNITGLRTVGSLCKRCGKRKTEVLSVREGPPVLVTSWIAYPVTGRVVPASLNDNTRSET